MDLKGNRYCCMLKMANPSLCNVSYAMAVVKYIFNQMT